MKRNNWNVPQSGKKSLDCLGGLCTMQVPVSPSGQLHGVRVECNVVLNSMSRRI